MPIRFVCGECGLWEPFEGSCAVDGNPLEATDDPMVGTDLGAYRLVRVLGQGGMGRVYAAVHPASGSRVAIKLIAEQYAQDKELLERFFAEARAVNLIRHENIVNIIDFAQHEGRPFIVMELITGLTLRQLAHDAPIGGLVHVMIEVLAGLAAAHAIGIVHRDLKPDNILVTASGHAKVLDFGIAKLSQPLPNAPALRTQTGVVLGTPEYMAPEMVLADSVDGRADLYALGLILYELLVGRRPFKGGSDFDIMRAHVESQPIPPRQFRPDLPASLETVIMRALAKRPQDRFETATAMQKALRRIAIELLGDAQWKPLLGEWLPPAAMTESLVHIPNETQRSVATVRARRLSQEKIPARKPPRKHLHIAVPIGVAVVALTTITALVLTAKPDEPKQVVATAPPPPPPPPVAEESEPSPVVDVPDVPRQEPEVIKKTPPPRLDTRKTEAGPAPTVSAPDVKPIDWSKIDQRDVAWRSFLPTAIAMAKKEASDARLIQIKFRHVGPDGRIDLSRRATVDYEFRSRTRDHCEVLVHIDQDGLELARSGNSSCEVPGMRSPQCSLAAIRERLARKRPDLQNDFLTVLYQDNRWVLGANVFADDCGAEAAPPPELPRAPVATTDDVPTAPTTTPPPTTDAPIPPSNLDLTKVEHDPKRFDWRAYLPIVKKHALGVAPDAKLTTVVLEPVAKDGTIDLTTGGPSRFYFRSQARSIAKSGCTITFEVGTRVQVSIDNTGCIAPFIADPPCTTKQLIATAVEKRNVSDGKSRLRFDSLGWHIEPVGGGQRHGIDDACP